MASFAVDIASLKILMAALYAHVAGRQGSADKAQAFVDHVKNTVFEQMEIATKDLNSHQREQVEEINAALRLFFEGLEFTQRPKP